MIEQKYHFELHQMMEQKICHWIVDGTVWHQVFGDLYRTTSRAFSRALI
jgi:hypothetical protein